jgi:hypothetical protein
VLTDQAFRHLGLVVIRPAGVQMDLLESVEPEAAP